MGIKFYCFIIYMSYQLISKSLKNLIKVCPVEKIQVFKEEVSIVIRPSLLINFLMFFKNHILYQFKVLTCISGVDYPLNKYRFQIIYELLTVRYNFRIKIKFFVNELMTVDSSNNIYFTAGWYECEIWDMFGIFFNNHFNLKRILTDYGFEGYPLRKDFPLSGFIEMRYHESEKRVLNESIELSQEFRTFNFSSPWHLEKYYE